MQLRGTGRQLPCRTDTSASELPEHRGVGGDTKSGELLCKGCTRGLRCDATKWTCTCADRVRRRTTSALAEDWREEKLLQSHSARVTADGEGKTLTRHSRHHTPPSASILAALSSFFPHPALPSCFRRPFASCPPQTRQPPCHLVPWGPGTTPLSMGETAFWHPGQEDDPPKRGCGIVNWF